MSASRNELDAIATVFNNQFAGWDIELTPDAILLGKRGTIGNRGWRIHYLVDSDEVGEIFLEYYATHRMTNDRHVRIHTSGRAESLPAIQEMYMYKPEIPGDEERAEADYREHNKRIAEELKDEGLIPSRKYQRVPQDWWRRGTRCPQRSR